MRRDINFLDCIKQGEKKKNSSAMTAVAIIVILVALIVMVFLFVKLKTDYKANADLMTKLEQEKNNPKFKENEKAYQEAKQKYNDYLQYTLGKDFIEEKNKNYIELGYDIIYAIFDCAEANGENIILIDKMTKAGEEVEISCTTAYLLPLVNYEKPINDFKRDLYELEVSFNDAMHKIITEITVKDMYLNEDKHDSSLCTVSFKMILKVNIFDEGVA